MIPKEFFDFNQNTASGKAMLHEFWGLYKLWMVHKEKPSDIIVVLTTAIIGIAEANGYQPENVLELVEHLTKLLKQNLN